MQLYADRIGMLRLQLRRLYAYIAIIQNLRTLLLASAHRTSPLLQQCHRQCPCLILILVCPYLDLYLPLYQRQVAFGKLHRLLDHIPFSQGCCLMPPCQRNRRAHKPLRRKIVNRQSQTDNSQPRSDPPCPCVQKMPDPFQISLPLLPKAGALPMTAVYEAPSCAVSPSKRPRRRRGPLKL